MRKFTMCRECQSEYDDPRDRRFHAQPNACSVCGPQLELWDRDAKVLAKREDALTQAVAALRRGEIVAVKGLGGFHLLVNALDSAAVQRLRQRKAREEKPFALMYPSLESVKQDCQVSALEERLLLSPESPIVLLVKKSNCQIAEDVAPRNPYLGVMLAYTPLHVLLLRELGSPVVATSGNRSDEPMCIDETLAPHQLAGIADLFLVHDRPIARPVDDSIVRIMAGRELVIRRARGYAPLPFSISGLVDPILAVGSHLKNTVALAFGNDVFVSQHIGDLENESSYQVFQKTIRDLENFYERNPAVVAHDLHPAYLSTQYAQGLNIKKIPVQHHYAHILSCLAENEVKGPCLGIAWDGTGHGLDGTVWGGEFLLCEGSGFKRVAHFQPFPLPGGEIAIREPRRSALGLLYQTFGEEVFSWRDLAPLQTWSDNELVNLKVILKKSISCPMTSSVGRWFDAVAALVGIRQQVRFEGQAAMELEFAVAPGCDEVYGFGLSSDLTAGDCVVTGPLAGIVEDVRTEISAGVIAAKFHNTLVEIMVAVAKRVGQNVVALSGGCFQNKYLTERAIRRLQEEGFKVYWHQRVPPNDGGIALGQVVAARQQNRV